MNKTLVKRACLFLLALCLLVTSLAGCAPAAPEETGEAPIPVSEGLEETLVRTYGRAKTDAILGIQAGDVIRFGNYEKNNKEEDGAESVEWIVLDREDTTLLLISKFSLDCKPFNEVSEDTTWETCTLRAWLNGAFLETCFDEQDRQAIVPSPVAAEKNPRGKVSPGNDTTDQVYVLSYSEAERYFPTDDERRSEPTAYAAAQGARTNDNWSTKRGHATAYWWLRNPGGKATTVVVVNERGILNGNFFKGVDATTVGVRPVLRVDIAALPKISFPRKNPLEPDLDAMD